MGFSRNDIEMIGGEGCRASCDFAFLSIGTVRVANDNEKRRQPAPQQNYFFHGINTNVCLDRTDISTDFIEYSFSSIEILIRFA